MSSTQTNRSIGKAELHFRDAFDRLKSGKPTLLPKGTPVSQNNVAKEAGVVPSALRRSRFPDLVKEIQVWVDAHRGQGLGQSPTAQSQAQRARNRTLREEVADLKLQRDLAQSKLVDAETYIVELVRENERLKANCPETNVVPLRPADRGKKNAG